MAFLLSPNPSFASENLFSPDYHSCLNQAVGDFSILECTQEELEKQDQRLNTAYKNAMQALSPTEDDDEEIAKGMEEQKKKLREAQRSWITFRDAWGEYILSPEGGTLARVMALTWHLEATRNQAIALEGGDEFQHLPESEFSPSYHECLENSDGITVEIKNCLGEEWEKQDNRLNAAYKALMAGESESQREALRKAQRAWLKFRDTYSDYLYDPNGGTIAGIISGTWFLNATTDQALRLEVMNQ